MNQNLFFTFLLLLLGNMLFAQNDPQLVVEESRKGYNVFLEIDDVSKVFQIHLESVSNENNTKEVKEVAVDDVVNNVSIKNLGFSNSQTELTVIITDFVGNKKIYPAIEININELL